MSGTLDHVRVWAMVTGLVMVAAAILSLLRGQRASTLEMLAVGIGSFELTLTGYDWIWRRGHGRS